MKKVFQFIRSMRFGVIIMAVIAAVCAVATALGAEQIYHSWYFIALFGLLCVNLLFCSIVRVTNVPKQRKALIASADRAEVSFDLPGQDRAAWLKKHHFARQKDGGYMRHGFGMYGSFITHVAILLLLVAAACNFIFAEKADYQVHIGDSIVLEDGTSVRVDDFHTRDEKGGTEYESALNITLPDGTEKQSNVLVNYPVRAGRYKIYQQNYYPAAVIGVQTGPDEKEEIIKLDEPAFLTLDNETGVFYSQLFGEVRENEDGTVSVSYTSTDIVNPAYEVQVIDGVENKMSLVYPNTTVEAGGILFNFHMPETYPGLRVKVQPEWTLVLLYASFVILLIGLYLCFFYIPIAASDRNGIALAGRKDITDWIEQVRSDEEEPKDTETNG